MVTPRPKGTDMTKTIRRLASLFLLCCCLAAALASCGKAGDFTVNTRKVMTIGDYDVTYDEYRYFYLAAMKLLSDGSEDFWEQESAPVARIHEEALASLRKKYALRTFAEQYHIKLSSADKDAIEAFMEDCVAKQDDEQGFRELVMAEGLTGRLFRDQYEMVYYYDRYLRDLLYTGYDNHIPVDTQTILQDVRDNFYHYTQILIANDKGEEPTANKALADKVYAELQKGVDFYNLAEEYTDWKTDAKAGQYATLGELLRVAEEAILALEIGGTFSKVVESEVGYHIFLRLPLEDTYISSHMEELTYASATRRYDALLEAKGASLSVSYTSYYDTLTFDKLVMGAG